jgi:hypothetical protein
MTAKAPMLVKTLAAAETVDALRYRWNIYDIWCLIKVCYDRSTKQFSDYTLFPDMSSAVRKPDFIIAGATRSGTSTLHHALSKSPHIFMPSQKELHFFYKDGDYEQGKAFYAEYFDGASNDVICGEASPTYLTKGYTLDASGAHQWQPEDDSAVRLKETYPDMKIVLSLRHPAKRVHSFFWRVVWQGHEHAISLEQAIEAELMGERKPEETPLCPLYLSHYKTHLEHWFQHFPKENILILIMEEWTKDPAGAIAKIEEFVGAKPSGLVNEDIQATNQGRRVAHPFLEPLTRIAPKSKIMRKLTRKFLTKQGYEPLSDETLEKLAKVFSEDIDYLEGVLGRKIEVWR